MKTLIDLIRIYQGSDGDATLALYAELEQLGPAGKIGVDLFRAQKSSERAKAYRGGGYRGMAYGRKGWALGNLVAALRLFAAELGLAWGWGIDEKQPVHRHVLYVDLPTGQVSFHGAERLDGPDYPGQWDGVPGQSADRVLRWIARLFKATAEAENANGR